MLLWSVALGTGFASGLITEVVRTPATALLKGTGLGEFLDVSPEDHFFGPDNGSEENRGLSGVVEIVLTFWTGQNILARGLRALCFDMPLARPMARA